MGIALGGFKREELAFIRNKREFDRLVEQFSKEIGLDAEFFKLFTSKVQYKGFEIGEPIAKVKDQQTRCYLKQYKNSATLRMITDQTGKCVYGMQYDKVVSGYYVEAYCARNVAGAVICAYGKKGRKPIASISYLKKEQKHAILRDAIENNTSKALFSALLGKFEKHLGYTEEKMAKRLAYEKPLKSVWCVGIFTKLTDQGKVTKENLEAYVRRVAEVTKVDPIGICAYLQTSKIKVDGLNRVLKKLQGERKNILEIYEKHAHIKDLETRIKAVATEVRIDPITACTYLLASGKKIGGLSTLQQKLQGERKNILEIYEKHAHIKDLETRIKAVATEVRIDPITACTYLLASGKEMKGIGVLQQKLQGEKKNLFQIYEKHAHIKDLETRIKAVATEVRIDPITACGYLRASGIKPKRISTLQQELLSKKKS